MTTAASAPVTVLIVDDHSLVRQGLQTFLELADDILVIGEAADGSEAIEQACRTLPDVVLMDLVMPGIDGITATRTIRERCPSTQVIALTSFSADEQVFSAIEAGASGYLLKDVSPDDLVRAIHDVHQGKAPLHPDVARKLVNGIAGRQEPEPDQLTPRELEVLRLIASGLSNREIADRLVISHKTVKVHVSHILGKLQVADRTRAAIYALRNNLGPLE
jgi:NarL family two-component system response regulator LiaR